MKGLGFDSKGFGAARRILCNHQGLRNFSEPSQSKICVPALSAPEPPLERLTPRCHCNLRFPNIMLQRSGPAHRREIASSLGQTTEVIRNHTSTRRKNWRHRRVGQVGRRIQSREGEEWGTRHCRISGHW